MILSLQYEQYRRLLAYIATNLQRSKRESSRRMGREARQIKCSEYTHAKFMFGNMKNRVIYIF